MLYQADLIYILGAICLSLYNFHPVFEGRSTKLTKTQNKSKIKAKRSRNLLKYNQEGLKKECLLKKITECFLKHKSLKCQLQFLPKWTKWIQTVRKTTSGLQWVRSPIQQQEVVFDSSKWQCGTDPVRMRILITVSFQCDVLGLSPWDDCVVTVMMALMVSSAWLVRRIGIFWWKMPGKE